MSIPSPLLSPPPAPQPLPLSSDSSSCTHCPELDLSITLSPAPRAVPTHLKPRPQPDLSHLKPRPQSQRKKNTQVYFEPVVVTVTPEPRITWPQQPIRSQRRSRGHLHGGASARWEEPPAVPSNENLVCLEGVELNTTLALKAELQSLQRVEFNSQKAIQETLRKSERTKNLINSRATEGVNVCRSQLLFSSLASVDVQTDQLISQALQDRLLLAPPPRCCHNKPTDSPSVLPFVTSDLHRQKPLPLEEEPVTTRLRPLPCLAHSTFDLYRRQRCWEAVS